MQQFASYSLAILGSALFAAFSSSTSYQLQTYNLGGGGTNSASSTHYKVQGNAGETSGPDSTSAHFQTKSGSIEAEQANVPPAPTLSNGSNTYYDHLNIVLATGGNPTTATFAIAFSSNNFSTTQYVQVDGTLGSSPYFQTYASWGGTSGTSVVGLAPSTTYYAKVSASDGTFTQSAYSPVASLATVGPTISFSLTPSSQNLGSLLPNSVTTGASTISYSLSTNADYGGSIYVSGQYGGLYSPATNYTIPATSTNLATASQGFGIQGASASSPLTIDSPYNGTSNTVGGESTSLAPLFSATSPISSGTASANIQAKPSTSAPASSDYTEVLTFLAAASF